MVHSSLGGFIIINTIHIGFWAILREKGILRVFFSENLNYENVYVQNFHKFLIKRYWVYLSFKIDLQTGLAFLQNNIFSLFFSVPFSIKNLFCLTGFFNKYEGVIHVNRRTYVDRKDDSRQFKGSVFVLFKVNACKLCTLNYL